MVHYVEEIGVLIETLWNVKNEDLIKILGLEEVLIETLWNVKRKCRKGI